MTETMVNGVKFKVWSDFIARCTFAENEDGDARIIKSAGYISNDLTIRKAIALAYNLPTFRKNAKKAVAENATVAAESDTEVEQNVETAEQIQAEEQKTEFKKEVITMKNIIVALAEELANTLETYKKYDAEFMYWEAQYNFPADEFMRERALRHKNGLREEAEAERKRAVETFYEKYEGTEYEDEASMVDVIRVMRKAHSEACKISEQMRRANGIFIE